MDELEILHEIKQRLKWELLLKSTTASPAVALIAFGVSYFRFGITQYADLVSALMVLCGLNTVVRFFIGKWTIQKKFEKKTGLRLVFYSLALNVALWTATFLIVFLQIEPTGIPFSTAFMVSVSLMTASVLTLSYSPTMAICFQLGLLSGNIISFGREYFLHSNGDYFFMFLAMIILAFYYVRQTRDFYRQLFDKYRYEVELEISLQKLQASNKKVLEETARAENSSRLAALGDMAGGMAHEINTPLAIIQLRTEEIFALVEPKTAFAEDIKSKLNSVVTAANRINRIIKSLLQISRKAEGPDFFEDIKVKNLLDDVLNLYQEKLLLAGIALEIEPIPDVAVKTKQALVSQVLLNLLSNAFDQISEQNDQRKYLKIFFRVNEEKLTICIENSGQGISEVAKDKIFQPFFTSKAVGKGTGLGLSVCKGIIESLKERIWLDRNLPNTTFCFTLPIAIPTNN